MDEEIGITDEGANSETAPAPLGQVERLVSMMRLLEVDHDPDGWPAVQMKDISLLCDAVENAVPSINLLQDRLDAGQYIEKQPDGEWWLFEKDGDGVCGGKELRDILINLIFIDC